jgi:Putative vitamin uptake transporter
MRATGSTIFSQLIDSFVIIAIAFWRPGKVKTTEFLTVAASNYSFKLLIALGVTPPALRRPYDNQQLPRLRRSAPIDRAVGQSERGSSGLKSKPRKPISLEGLGITIRRDPFPDVF